MFVVRGEEETDAARGMTWGMDNFETQRSTRNEPIVSEVVIGMGSNNVVTEEHGEVAFGVGEHGCVEFVDVDGDIPSMTQGGDGADMITVAVGESNGAGMPTMRAYGFHDTS